VTSGNANLDKEAWANSLKLLFMHCEQKAIQLVEHEQGEWM